MEDVEVCVPVTVDLMGPKCGTSQIFCSDFVPKQATRNLGRSLVHSVLTTRHCIDRVLASTGQNRGDRGILKNLWEFWA